MMRLKVKGVLVIYSQIIKDLYPILIILIVLIFIVLFNRRKNRYIDIRQTRNNVFDSLLKVYQSPAIIIDDLKQVKAYNKSFGKLFNIKLSYNESLDVDKFAYIIDFIESGLDHDNIELHYENSDYLVNINHFKTPSFSGIFISYNDVTIIKEAQRLQDMFIQDAKHELKTPIASIKGLSELILIHNITDLDKIYEFVNLINKENERLSSIINNLTMEPITKVEFGPVNLNKTILEVAAIFESFNLNNNIKLNINTTFKEDIYSNEKIIKQILNNLLENAYKYTDQGFININLFEQDDDVIIEVQDSGIGIASEEVENIFNRFYRVDKSRTRRSGGSGLGLSIVKELVTKINAEIEVISEEQAGTIFRLILKKD